jgi:hypothetical protein
MMMNRVLRATAVVLVMASSTAIQKTARAAMTSVDSSSFSWKYEMTDDPTGQDLDTNLGPDFSTVLGAGTLSGGVSTLSGYATYASNGASLAGAVWRNISFENGYTVEVRLKAAQAAGESASAGIMGCSETTKCSQLFVSDSGQYWGESVGGGSVSLGIANNADAFHVFRIAQLPNQDSFSVWRDGVLLSDTLTSAYAKDDVAPLLYVGQAVAGEATNGATQVDYIRITSGAFAPVPEPSTIVLALAGVIGLLAYAWRRER